MYIYRVEHPLLNTKRKEIVNYSDEFEDIEKAEEWYNNYGKSLEKRFNRTFLLYEVKYKSNQVKYYTKVDLEKVSFVE